MDTQRIWQTVLGELELTLSKANFTTWFKSTAITSYNNGEVIIGVPNGFTKEWLENKYNKDIFRALANVTKNQIKNVKYEVTTIKTAVSVPANQSANDKPAPALPDQLSNTRKVASGQESNLNERYTFENFIVGPSNELAYAACKSVAKSPSSAYNPLFVYGGVGLGKTHLLVAVGNAIRRRYANKKIKYVTSESFTNEFVDSIGQSRKNNFKERYRLIDVLIIDDIQFIAGKEQTQEEFFHTFNTLYNSNKQIILSSDRPPKAIPTLEERLRSRFEGGMIADIGTPDLETRTAILQKKCLLKNFNIPNDVLNYIAQNIRHNIRELEGALNRIMAHCQLNNSKPSIESTCHVLANIIANPKQKAATPKQILDAVASFYDLKIADITGRSRKKEFVKPRQIAMSLMREETKSSFPAIGQELGGKDHTTAMHACEKITREVGKDDNLRQEIELIRQRLYIPQ